MMVMKWKRLHKEAQLPQRQTEGAAGYDLRACVEAPVTLEPGEGYSFPTGLAGEIPQGLVGLIFCRSGLGVKHGVSLPNCVGVIDSDYRGELIVPLRNFGDKAYTIQPGERIAQLVLLPVFLLPVEEVEELSQTQRERAALAVPAGEPSLTKVGDSTSCRPFFAKVHI